MTIRLQVTIKSVYGENKFYPANEAADWLAAIAGTKTLTLSTLRNALHMGMEIEFVHLANAAGLVVTTPYELPSLTALLA